MEQAKDDPVTKGDEQDLSIELNLIGSSKIQTMILDGEKKLDLFQHVIVCVRIYTDGSISMMPMSKPLANGIGELYLAASTSSHEASLHSLPFESRMR